MSAHDRVYRAQNFGIVLYLAGKGYEPMRAEMSRDGSGKVEYVFSPACREDVGRFYELKDVLNRMSLEARRIALTPAVPTHLTRTAGDRHVPSTNQQ